MLRGALLATALLLVGCGSDAESADSAGPEPLDVVASFYPLQFVTERVGGEHVAVENMTPPGTEPHDLELSAQDTASLQDADMVVYLSGFTPALDETIESIGADLAVDVAAVARLDRHGVVDPHFWLDPTRLADVADAVAEELGARDPAHGAEFTANAASLRNDLEALDAEFDAGLDACASTSIVTSHAAFGHLADRYSLTQVGIAGLSPDEDPSPAKLAEVIDFVTDHGVTTIYSETLADPAIAATVAAETGASTAVLDPLEGLTEGSTSEDYFGVMRSNLETLRAGQDCT